MKKVKLNSEKNGSKLKKKHLNTIHELVHYANKNELWVTDGSRSYKVSPAGFNKFLLEDGHGLKMLVGDLASVRIWSLSHGKDKVP